MEKTSNPSIAWNRDVSKINDDDDDELGIEIEIIFYREWKLEIGNFQNFSTFRTAYSLIQTSFIT